MLNKRECKNKRSLVLFLAECMNFICYDRNVMTYKVINKLCPENLLDKYLPRSCFSTYNTRNSQDLQIPGCRIEFFKKSFHYASLKA